VIFTSSRVRSGSIESMRTVQPGSSVKSSSINTYAKYMHNIYIYIYAPCEPDGALPHADGTNLRGAAHGHVRAMLSQFKNDGHAQLHVTDHMFFAFYCVVSNYLAHVNLLYFLAPLLCASDHLRFKLVSTMYRSKECLPKHHDFKK
jgi:hypothetical protein